MTMAPSPVVGRVLAHLPGARPNGRGWQAQCPAHNDDHASLSIAEGDDGRVLVKCHAGCPTAAILRAIRLELRDLFPAANPTSRAIQATYDYCDEHGALLFQVVRFVPKGFAQRRRDAIGDWLWKLDGIRRVVYRLPDLQGKDAVFVVEGEKDAENLWRLGLPATTNAGGAGKWRTDYANQLRSAGVKRVAVLPDNDPAGEAHGRQVARSCHDVGLIVRLLPLPGLAPKGDVSDWLRGHDKAALLEAVRACPVFDPSRLVASVPKLELTSLADLLAEPDEATDWLVEDRIPAGAIVLLAGLPKAGKSTLARDLTYAIATGQPWLGWPTHAGAVWYLTFEDKRSEVRQHFTRMGATGTEPVRVFAGQAPSGMTGTLHELAATERPALIVVDTLQRLIRAKDLNDYAEVTRCFDPLLRLARETGATLLLLTHSSTHRKRLGLDAVLGSTALSGSVDNVFVLTRDERYRTLSTCQRIGPDLEPTILTLDGRTGRLQAAGRRRDADVAEVAGRIVEALRLHDDPVQEKWVKDSDNVEGSGRDKVHALRLLVRGGQVIREGAGGRADPYQYRLRSACNGQPHEPTEPREPRVPKKSSTVVGPNLDFEGAGTRVHARTYVPRVPDERNEGSTPGRCCSGTQVHESCTDLLAATAKRQEQPHETGSDIGTRDAADKEAGDEFERI